MTPEPQERIPYIGPLPFLRRHRDLFFGRDNEVSELLSLVISHRVLLLYAQSGAGKTSLLNAGLVPVLEEEGFEVLPLARVAGVIPKGIEPTEIPNLYVFNTLMSWSEQEDADPGTLRQQSLADFLRQRERSNDEEGRARPRVVVFDQFEELFSAYPERWAERKEFFERVADMLADDPLLRVIFAIREDYIAQLDPYAHLLPERLRTRYRLERLRAEAGCQAVEGPLRDTGRTFAEGVASRLVNKLLNIRVENAAGEIVEAPGEYVEPVQLQIVCQSLWRNLPKEVTVIVADHLERFGDVQEVLRSFYETAIATAKRQTGVSESDLRAWFTNKLITPAGTRGTVFQGQKQTEGIANAAVEVLEAQHIIRAERRAGARWYELTHDRLIEPIRKSNEPFERAEAQRRAKARLLRRIAATLIAVCIVTLGAIIMIYLFVFPLSLTVNAVDGSVVKNPDKARYSNNATVTLEAVADTGYSFTNWSGDLSDSNNPTTLVMDTNKSVTANFDRIYSLSVTSVHGSVVKDPNQVSYRHGARVTLTAVPNKGYTFTNWSGDYSDSSNNSAMLVMDADKAVTASFVPETYSLSVRADGGSVTRSPDKAGYTYTDAVTLEAKPNAEYSFQNWSGDLSGSTNPAALVMDADKSVTAIFARMADARNVYSLTTKADGGTVTKEPDKASYNHGEAVTIVAIPNNGYGFANWLGDLSGRANPVTLVMDTNKSVTANFVAFNAGKEETNSIGMKLVYIPAGSFVMGSGESAAQLVRAYGGEGSDFANEFPPHPVRISKGFWMGQTEVTQGQYKFVMNAEPWSGTKVQRDPNCPAGFVSWDDAVEFCRKLSQREGETYRLPTEAEWEYACRAGTETRFSFGQNDLLLDGYAWFRLNANNSPRMVAKKTPNRWGLYDMHGNVTEWCNDWYAENYYSNSPPVDPTGPPFGTKRCCRGGSYYDSRGNELRCSFRLWQVPNGKYAGLGFRVVRQPKTTYSLTTKADGGSVTKSPDKALYNDGETVILTAMPKAGYSFLNWSSDLSGSTNRVALVMNANKSVTANFALKSDSLKGYKLTATAANGSVTKSRDRDAYTRGETVTLRAIPNAGYSFLNWSGDLSGRANPATLVMNADKSIIANFALKSVVTPPGFYIHNGCVKFGDREDVISKGPITAVKVCHADYIYGLQLCYGRQYPQDGLVFGLNTREYGLQVTEWRVPNDQQIVGVEGQIARYGSGFLYVSRLRFITDKGTRSPQFGGQPGTPFVAFDQNGLPLRTISGSTNLRKHPALKRAITSMTFHFGY